MKSKDKRIDAYIAKSADFAKPILKHLRELVHKTCPNVDETMKWSFPHFDYKEEMMCSMASFKQHCAFGFRKASLMQGSKKLFTEIGKTAMGNLGQIKSLEDIPPDEILIASIKEAMKLNDEGIKVAKSKPIQKNEIKIPDYFKEALMKSKKAFNNFESFSPSHKREYLEWITEAKTEGTREKRMATALEWMEEDKSKNWKYVKK